ncbi:MAG: hypothetical protein KAX57_05180 [Rhodoferax sp.]|jgi:hypothetical protein|uniref:hypothetical protein n=1 Tax=Rhodoferax sp. TaxID=50421 RepID=UPI001B67DE25|nr:hypothetical protein [Rhodoferax sp.]MBP8286214.1 hypothetical protein [Rhodoferax sp.]MBP9149757.1 hypothetical protein [Rhodoferax sp.]MBP9736821.1 hypothetical protein [Rhodoferax sp.]
MGVNYSRPTGTAVFLWFVLNPQAAGDVHADTATDVVLAQRPIITDEHQKINAGKPLNNRALWFLGV